MLGGGRSGVVVDLFFDHRSIDIVRSEALCDLRHARRHHDPVRLDVRNVVEHKPRDGNLLNVVEPRSRRKMTERRVRRMKRQWNEGDETVRFVLDGTQPH